MQSLEKRGSDPQCGAFRAGTNSPANATSETTHLALREGRRALFIDHVASNLVIAISGFLSLVLPVVAVAQTLPDGPGKAVAEKMCTPCHGLQNVVKARVTKERWAAMVDDMVARGAEGSDDEIAQVINYLALNFAVRKVNVNKASAADLVSALGVTASDAAAIVNYRTDKGKFKELPDLMKVPGIDARKIASSKDSIDF